MRERVKCCRRAPFPYHNKHLSGFLFCSLLSLIASSASVINAVDASFIGRGAGSTVIGGVPLSKVDNMSRRPTKPAPSTAKNSAVTTHRVLKETRGGGTAMQMSDAVFNNAPLWESVSIIGGTNLLGLVISLATGSHLHLDLLGTGAFALAALPQLLGAKASALARVKVSATAVVVWGTKLAGFLFFRALKVKHDARLDSTLSTVSGTVGFWIISTLWGVLCSLPHTLGTTSSSAGNPTSLKVGTAMYIVGIVMESLADYQKWAFKAANPGKFCDAGLWSLSQHPNFFGNLLLWAGIFVMNAPALNPQRIAIALISPLFMCMLFYGQASGSITNAVELANAKYGSDPKYNEYVENVPLIIPKLFGKYKKG